MSETVLKESNKGITGTGLKVIAMIAMFIDHFAAIFLTDYLSCTVPNLSQEELMAWFQGHVGVAVVYMVMLLMRLIGRFGFPLFAFLLVEGFTHTHSVKRYAIHLFVFALISELPFNLGFASTLFFPSYQNVFFTLLLGLLCMASIKALLEKWGTSEKWKMLFYVTALLTGPYAVYMLVKNTWLVTLFYEPEENQVRILMAVAAVISLILFSVLGAKWETEKKNAFTFVMLSIMVFSMAAEALMTDYSGGGVLTIAVMYLFRENRRKAFSFGMLVLTMMAGVEGFAYLMLIPLSQYNGERGMKLNKYFFYAFYPVHIGLLYLLTLWLGYATFSLR